MKVPGNSNSARSPPIGPSQATPWKRRRHGPMPWRLAISWTTMKPMLWRLPAYFAPGFPSPTRSSIGIVPRQQTSLLLGRGGSRCRARSGTRSTWGSARRAFGRRAGSCGGSGGSGSGSSCFGGGLDFFRIARRRHDRDQGDVAGGDDAHAFRQGDVAQMLGIVDIELADVDVDAGRNGVGAAAHLDGGGDDADRGALAEPHEVHMQRQVANRIELEVAGNDAMLHAVDLDVMNGGEKTPGIDAVVQIGVIERDRQRRLAVAIDDSGNAAGTTFCPGGPLACPRTRRRLDQIDGRHDDILV